jgi:hypothetical protein
MNDSNVNENFNGYVEDKEAPIRMTIEEEMHQ